MKILSTVLALSVAIVQVSNAGVIVKRLTPVVPTPISFSNYTLEWKSLTTLQENAALQHGTSSYPHPAYELLQSLADAAVQKPLYTVVNKPFLPPSGDKHDWLTYAPYWWPQANCTAADPDDNCPFVDLDGQVNPDVYKLNDQRNLEYMSMDTETLAIAYLVFKKDAYAQQAADMLRYFFLNNATLMNPNMEYGQIIRGNGKSATHTGRAEGIISARALISPVRAVKILEMSGTEHWGKNDTAGMVNWFKQFHDWLLDNPIAIDEGDTTNNHLSYYTDSLITFSDFIDNYSTIQSKVDTFFKQALPNQITPNGTQPMEESRTLPFHYSAFNLDALTYMANFVSQPDPLTHGPYITNAWTQAGDSIVTAVQRLQAVVAGKTGQIEPGADLTEANPPTRAVTIQYPSKFCHVYKASSQSIVPYNNLWPLWTPHALWNCFN